MVGVADAAAGVAVLVGVDHHTTGPDAAVVRGAAAEDDLGDGPGDRRTMTEVVAVVVEVQDTVLLSHHLNLDGDAYRSVAVEDEVRSDVVVDDDVTVGDGDVPADVEDAE